MLSGKSTVCITYIHTYIQYAGDVMLSGKSTVCIRVGCAHVNGVCSRLKGETELAL